MPNGRWTNPQSVRRKPKHRKPKSRSTLKKALIILLLVEIGAIWLYASNPSSFDGVLKGFSQFQTPANSLLNTNSKEAYLRNYPVKVTYDVGKATEKSFFGKTYSYYSLKIYFYNTGSESASFIVGGVAIVDSNGRTYHPESIVFDPVTVYPGAKMTKEYRFDAFPPTGKLHIDIYAAKDMTVGWTDVSAQLEKLETVTLFFEYEK